MLVLEEYLGLASIIFLDWNVYFAVVPLDFSGYNRVTEYSTENSEKYAIL